MCRDLGVVEADPEDYIRRFGAELKQPHELPTCEAHHRTVSTHEVKKVEVAAPVTLSTHSHHHCCCNCNHHHCNCGNTNVRPAVQEVVHTTTAAATVCPVHNYASHNYLRNNAATTSYVELEGDIDALRLVDLDKHGLSAYKNVVNSYNTTGYRRVQ